MNFRDSQSMTRRLMLRAGVALSAAVAGSWLGARSGRTQNSALAPTPACDDGDEPTPPLTEGPFFTPGSPQRASLLGPGIAGARLLLEGFVLSTTCRPVSGALVDLWHADDEGVYDNKSYRLRGHQFTDEAGRYRFESIVPGAYGGRTRHYHVKVQAPSRPVLTTQLFFPDEPSNARDRIFRPDLVMELRDGDGKKRARFDFVLDLAS